MGHLNLHPETLALFRKELHRYPELSGQEHTTAERIIAFLNDYAPDEIISRIGGTGLVAVYRGRNAGKNILFRCELDALPITEVNNFDHRSSVDGVSHKCGHDGHMAIMCGLAAIFSADRPTNGDVYLLFQPAEEDGTGARKVFEHPKFKVLNPDYVFSLHNLPGYPKNQIVVKNGTFSCAVNSIIIRLIGKTSHAGEPHNGINPAAAIADIIKSFESKIQPAIHLENFCLITPVYINMGEQAYGVSAGEGEIHYTVRSHSNAQMDIIEKMLASEAQAIASKHQLKCQVSWTQPFRATENAAEAAEFILAAANAERLDVLLKPEPFSWGEDFGLFTEHFTGAMFGLGAGTETPALHNPDYDFPDDISAAGIAMFYQISQAVNAQ